MTPLLIALAPAPLAAAPLVDVGWVALTVAGLVAAAVVGVATQLRRDRSETDRSPTIAIDGTLRRAA